MNNDDMRKVLHDLSSERASIQRQLECGIITAVDASMEEENIMTKERKIKEQLVLSAHITKSGTPRKIEYKEGKGLWMTILPNDKRLYAKTRDILIDKLFDYYGLCVADCTIKGIFELALNEKQATQNVNAGTIKRDRYQFERFISSEFACRDIRSISKTDLQTYTQDMVNRIRPIESAFKAYKGILNLIFCYALEYDIISVNPVQFLKNAIYLKGCDRTKAKPEDKILSPEEIACVIHAVRERMTQKRYHGYFINGYAILLSIETGMRVGELCALKWSDIKDNVIHIHAQQLMYKDNGRNYYYVGWTKDEKGRSQGGREFPITDKIRSILTEIRELQSSLDIESEFVFCNTDGRWIYAKAYEDCLRGLCKALGLNVTNNHAFRMSLNSNVLIPLGIPVTERAQLLGHSVETNQKYYSYAQKDSKDQICALLNSQVTPRSHSNIVPFKQKESPETAILKAF